MTPNPEDRTLYQMLGVPPEVGGTQLEGLVERLRRVFAPAHYPAGCPGLRDLAARRLEEIEAAYEVLRDPERRAAYDAELGLDQGAVPIVPPGRLHRVLARSLASLGHELLTQDPSLTWSRRRTPDFDLMATTTRGYDRHEINFRMVPRLDRELLEGYCTFADERVAEEGGGLLRHHLTFVLASEVVDDELGLFGRLEDWNRGAWRCLTGRGARARIFVLLGPSGRVMAPGGVCMEAPVPHPRRLYRPNRLRAVAA